MPINANTLPANSIEFNGQQLHGRYRVTQTSFITYFEDQVKSAPLDERVSTKHITQWLLKNMAIYTHND
jgi:hypothetical protein